MSQTDACGGKHQIISRGYGDGAGGSGSTETGHLVAPILRPLLEQAIRESLRELALSAVQPELGVGLGGGSSFNGQSIDSIVREVASRVLEEAGPSLLENACHLSQAAAIAAGSDGTPNATAAVPPPPAPMLTDLKCTPWALWREDDSPGRRRPSNQVVSKGAFEDLPPQDNSGIAPDSPVSSETNEDTSLDKSLMDSALLSPLFGPATHEVPGSRQGSKASVKSRISGSLHVDQHVVREGLTVDHNSAPHLRMQWQGLPRSVLIVAKPGDRLVNATLQDMCAWLSSQGIVVILEPKLLTTLTQLRRCPHRQIRTFSKSDELEKRVDLVITVGGDGTLTWAVSLFRGPMPPVISFAAGSLGFLTPHPLDTWVRTLTRLLDFHRVGRPLSLVCRMRLTVTIRRRGTTPGEECDDHVQVQCLNEVLVHRGQSGCLAKLDVSVDGDRVTLVQGDGLILATPTGSTAYSLAAGGSMVHPSVPSILLTPVSPHSLSFRPAVLPDFAVVTVGVPVTARCGAALSVDGKDLCTLHLGDSIEVAMSSHPVPTICRTTETGDWFASVHEALQWNGRAEQK